MRYISVRGRNTCPSKNKRGDTRLTDQTVVFTARRSSSEQLPVDPPEHTGNRTPRKKNRRDDLESNHHERIFSL
ncbi:hypothetical protein F2Q68_00036109 [Brassica cretica]|uniref:Uncharacterized protein n=1 Tax=Brassica cretica TaxID=69181 RepID=A0A8S9GWQ2_BRACR|nr:hypothetical protein F2Q68_00036109 [Brassica cretica]